MYNIRKAFEIAAAETNSYVKMGMTRACLNKILRRIKNEKKYPKENKMKLWLMRAGWQEIEMNLWGLMISINMTLEPKTESK